MTRTIRSHKGGRTARAPEARIRPQTLDAIKAKMQERDKSFADLLEEQYGQGDDTMAKYTIGQVIEKKYSGYDFGVTALPENADRVTIKSIAPAGKFSNMTGPVYFVKRETVKNGAVIFSEETEMREDSIDDLNS